MIPERFSYINSFSSSLVMIFKEKEPFKDGSLVSVCFYVSYS